MTRTTQAAVEGILGSHYDGSTNLVPFIETASSLVDWVVSEDEDSVLAAAAPEVIERWLAAHFYAHHDQLMQQKTTGKASATFQGQTAMNLNSTQYGQTAMVCDYSGALARRNKEVEEGGRRRVGVTWLGTVDDDDASE